MSIDNYTDRERELRCVVADLQAENKELLVERDLIKSNHERLVKMVDDGSIHGRLYSAGLESERQIVALEKERDALLKALRRFVIAFDWFVGRSALTQSSALKGLAHSQKIRTEVYAAHDEARAAIINQATGEPT